MGLALGFMAFGIVPSVISIHSIPGFTTLYERVLCEQNPANRQTISIVQEATEITSGEMAGGTAYDSQMTCTDRDNRTTDVTTRRDLISGIGFTVLMILGVLCFFAGNPRTDTVEIVQEPRHRGSEVAPLPTAWSSAVNSISDPNAGQQASLKMLKALHEKGLLHKEAYEAARDQLLKG